MPLKTPRALLTVILIALLLPATTAAQAFTIRVLDAYSGKPVRGVVLNVWTGKGLRINSPDRADLAPIYYTDNAGNAVIQPRAGADTLSLLIGGKIYPCEPHPRADGNLNFSIHEIVENGTVADNVCGKARETPRPGVLFVFVKRRPWWQIP